MSASSERTNFKENEVDRRQVDIDCVKWHCMVRGCEAFEAPTIGIVSPLNTAVGSGLSLSTGAALVNTQHDDARDVNLHLRIEPPWKWEDALGGLCPEHGRQYRRMIYVFLYGERDVENEIRQHGTLIRGL